MKRRFAITVRDMSGAVFMGHFAGLSRFEMDFPADTPRRIIDLALRGLMFENGWTIAGTQCTIKECTPELDKEEKTLLGMLPGDSAEYLGSSD